MARLSRVFHTLAGSVPVVAVLLILGQGVAVGLTGVEIVSNPAPGAYSPQVVSIRFGQAVTWMNETADDHSVTADPPLMLFDSKPIPPGGGFDYTFDWSGTYPYHDSLNPTVTGTVKVKATVSPTSGPAGTKFTITVASVVTATQAFDVRVKLPGQTHWQPFESAQSTTFVFDSTGMPSGQWRFQSRLRSHSRPTHHSGWSPTLVLSVT